MICFVASFFQAAANYDIVIENDGFPPTLEDIWILGSAYSLINGRMQQTRHAIKCQFGNMLFYVLSKFIDG